MEDKEIEKLYVLIEKQIDDTLTDEEAAELEDLILTSEEARKIYIDTTSFNSMIFEKGIEGLRPLQLRIVAEALGIHESTVSRSTASVLIQTPRGTFPLKMFFSSGLQAKENEEGISARAIRTKIKDIIDRENPLKPTSDAKISDLLSKEGYRVARRTVAKYRELENIKSTSQRKRAHKLNELMDH